MSREDREEEAHGRLERQCRADVPFVCQFRDRRRKLRGVGDDNESPEENENTTNGRDSPKTRPEATHAVPLATMLKLVTVVRPQRSAADPASHAPRPPIAIVPNPNKEAYSSECATPLDERLCAR